jgi:hypothetical protein
LSIDTTSRGRRELFGAALFLILVQLAACGGGSEDVEADANGDPAPAASAPPPPAPPPAAPPPPSNPPAPPPPNAAPAIAGSPQSRVTAGSRYEFRPQASDPEGAMLSFAVINQPSWSSFDAATGTLAGTPSAVDVGIHSGVAISASDGSHVSTLPAFTIEVVAAPPSPYFGTPTIGLFGSSSMTFFSDSLASFSLPALCRRIARSSYVADASLVKPSPK